MNEQAIWIDATIQNVDYPSCIRYKGICQSTIPIQSKHIIIIIVMIKSIIFFSSSIGQLTFLTSMDDINTHRDSIAGMMNGKIESFDVQPGDSK